MGSQDNPTSKVIMEPKFLREMEEHMVKLRKYLKIAWDRRKHYAKKKTGHTENSKWAIIYF